ncbi:MAG TPA: hypothetical protein VHB20_17815 [Verrucomicrobiae bacterium]|jgi:hypothetical protein|nr:hypothetical protein [Verrucomicrobiae bacterium]
MKTIRVLTAAGLGSAFGLAAPAARACAACSGQSDSLMAQGMNAGIYALLGVIGSVLCAACTFFVFLARRSAAVARAEQDKTKSV